MRAMSANSLKITRFYGEKEKREKAAELKKSELNAKHDFSESLSDLKANSKPMINTLSIVAGDCRRFGKSITEVIETHLMQVALPTNPS